MHGILKITASGPASGDKGGALPRRGGSESRLVSKGFLQLHPNLLKLEIPSPLRVPSLKLVWRDAGVSGMYR